MSQVQSRVERDCDTCAKGRGSDEKEERAMDPPSRSTLRRAEQGGPSAAAQERGVVPFARHDGGRAQNALYVLIADLRLRNTQLGDRMAERER